MNHFGYVNSKNRKFICLIYFISDTVEFWKIFLFWERRIHLYHKEKKFTFVFRLVFSFYLIKPGKNCYISSLTCTEKKSVENKKNTRHNMTLGTVKISFLEIRMMQNNVWHSNVDKALMQWVSNTFHMNDILRLKVIIHCLKIGWPNEINTVNHLRTIQ